MTGMLKPWLKKGFDKVLWVVIGGVIMALFSFWLHDISPDVVVRQYYNTVDPAVVPSRVGDLEIEYKMPMPPPPSLPHQGGGEKDITPIKGGETAGVYLVEVVNEGRGPEEDLRVQIKTSDAMNLAFTEEPNLSVYKPLELAGEIFLVNGPRIEYGSIRS